jgi:hypothetical protein
VSSQDNQFVALGPADIGFKTHATRITTGAEIHGTLAGVVGRCQGSNGDGVIGFGTGTGGGRCQWTIQRSERQRHHCGRA